MAVLNLRQLTDQGAKALILRESSQAEANSKIGSPAS